MTLPIFSRPNSPCIDADDRSIAVLPRFKKHEIFAILRDYHATYDAAYTQPTPERSVASIPEEAPSTQADVDLDDLANAIDDVMDNLLPPSEDSAVVSVEMESNDLINVLNDSVGELQVLMRSLELDSSTEAQQLSEILNTFTADLKNVVRHLLDLRLVSSMTVDWINDDYPELTQQDASTFILAPIFDDEDETMLDLNTFGMDCVSSGMSTTADATVLDAVNIEELNDDAPDCDVQCLVQALLDGRETVDHRLPDYVEDNFWEELEQLLDDTETDAIPPSVPVSSSDRSWTVRFLNEADESVADGFESLDTPDNLLDAIASSYQAKVQPKAARPLWNVRFV